MVRLPAWRELFLFRKMATLKRVNWMKSEEEEKLQHWTNSFIPLNTSQVCSSSSMGSVDKCFCVCAARLNRNCTFIEKLSKHKCVTRQKSSSGFDFTKPWKICDTKFASKGIPKLNHFYTKVICILNCIDCPTLSYYPSCSFRDFFYLCQDW